MKNNKTDTSENIECLKRNQFISKLEFWPGRESYDEIQNTNFCIFVRFTNQIKLDEKFKALKLKIKTIKDKNVANAVEANLNKIIERYEHIQEEADENFMFYYHYLQKFDYNKNYYSFLLKGPEELKNKIGKEITNMQIDNYIRYSQEMIIFLNKIKSFNNINNN
jgi:hypothetical protein